MGEEEWCGYSSRHRGKESEVDEDEGEGDEDTGASESLKGVSVGDGERWQGRERAGPSLGCRGPCCKPHLAATRIAVVTFIPPKISTSMTFADSNYSLLSLLLRLLLQDLALRCHVEL